MTGLASAAGPDAGDIRPMAARPLRRGLERPENRASESTEISINPAASAVIATIRGLGAPPASGASRDKSARSSWTL